MEFWFKIIPVLLAVLGFYFTLTFLEHLKSEEQRIVRQSKLAAVICIALALIIPLLNN